mmetsp:Transcript_51127/g.143988  ORF Transcript_51127/g.143988 Transcript_51127/m.143988 type:complete len:312 (-) Transcript_51127:188-1123(-)
MALVNHGHDFQCGYAGSLRGRLGALGCGEGDGRGVRSGHPLDSRADPRRIAIRHILRGRPLVLHPEAEVLRAALPAPPGARRRGRVPPGHPRHGVLPDRLVPPGAHGPGLPGEVGAGGGEPGLRHDRPVPVLLRRVPLPQRPEIREQERLHRRVPLLDQLLRRGAALHRVHPGPGGAGTLPDRGVLLLQRRGSPGDFRGRRGPHLPDGLDVRAVDLRPLPSLRGGPLFRLGRVGPPGRRGGPQLHDDLRPHSGHAVVRLRVEPCPRPQLGAEVRAEHVGGPRAVPAGRPGGRQAQAEPDCAEPPRRRRRAG